MSYASQHNYICSSNRNTTFPYYLCKLLVSLEVLVPLEWTFREALSLSSIIGFLFNLLWIDSVNLNRLWAQERDNSEKDNYGIVPECAKL